MSARFFVETPLADAVTITGAEAHHLLHVMRAKGGDQVTLFDGSGIEATAIITATRRSEVECEVVDRQEVDRELPFELTLGVAMPKGDRQKVLVEKLTELGVTRLVPLVTERSVAAPKTSALEKLRRTIIESSKQCERNRLMELAAPTPLDAFVSNDFAGTARYVAHPSGSSIETCGFVKEAVASRIAIVGPEGGLSDAEVARAEECGWRVVSLGARILRIETAAQVMAVCLGLAQER